MSSTINNQEFKKIIDAMVHASEAGKACTVVFSTIKDPVINAYSAELYNFCYALAQEFKKAVNTTVIEWMKGYRTQRPHHVTIQAIKEANPEFVIHCLVIVGYDAETLKKEEDYFHEFLKELPHEVEIFPVVISRDYIPNIQPLPPVPSKRKRR